jgi:tetratricopeptide (TPR) repeat protein
VNLSSATRSHWKTLVAIPLLLAAAALLQARIDAETRTEAAPKEELLVRSGALLKKLSLGYDPLLADIYWTRVVQYYGSRVGDPNVDFSLLPPLLNITTTLDPHLVVAYRFGAIFLSEPKPAGAGRTDLAVDLVKRGIAANPDEWRLDYDLGVLYYWRLKDYHDAAAAFLAASNLPKAPFMMLKLAAAGIAEKGGSIDTSRMIFAELYKSTNDRKVQKMALEELKALKAQEDEMELDKIIQQYEKRFGRKPASMLDLVNAKLLPGLPVDPGGIPYAIGADGKCRLGPRSPIEAPER